jgi:hypothetical protein
VTGQAKKTKKFAMVDGRESLKKQGARTGASGTEQAKVMS